MRAARLILFCAIAVLGAFLLLARPSDMRTACEAGLGGYMLYEAWQLHLARRSPHFVASAPTSNNLLVAPVLFCLSMFIPNQITNPSHSVTPESGHLLPHVEDVQYTGYAKILGNQLSIKHQIAIDLTPTPSLSAHTAQSANMPLQLAAALKNCGWTEYAAMNFSRTTDQPLKVRWFPFKTVNLVSPPPTKCGTYYLRSKDGSTLILEAPLNKVTRTDPEIKTRSESLLSDTETIVIPVSLDPDQTQPVQVELVSPLLSNALGIWLLNGALWEPVKWILLALCGIFGAQIKAGVLLPLGQKIFKFLHIPFQDQVQDQAEDQPDSQEP